MSAHGTSGSTDGDNAPVAVEVAGSVATLTLNRPSKLNALNRALLEGIADAAAELNRNDVVKVAIVRGAGRSFCAGFDLMDDRWAELGPPEVSASTGLAMASAMSGMRAVTIAAVHGHCIGGGVVLASACDIRLACESARFRIPEIDLGIPLFWGGIPLLVRELGPSVTKELVMTGREFTAKEAREMRFVAQRVPRDQLVHAARELAETLAAKPLHVLRVTKRQVDAVSAPIPNGYTSADADVAGLAEAFSDQESRASAAAYVKRTLGRSVD